MTDRWGDSQRDRNELDAYITRDPREDDEMEYPPNTPAALLLVEEERYRQELLKEQGRFTHTLADPMPESEKAACIMEEVGEVCRNVLARMQKVTDGEVTDGEMVKELSQVAALSVAWIESLI